MVPRVMAFAFICYLNFKILLILAMHFSFIRHKHSKLLFIFGHPEWISGYQMCSILQHELIHIFKIIFESNISNKNANVHLQYLIAIE